MKKIIFLLSILILISCKKEQEKPQFPEIPKIVKSRTEIIRERDFPLKNSSKVEILSYENRMYWDKEKKGDKQSRYTKDLVVDYKLNFDSTRIKERIQLNSLLKAELIKVMSQDSCKIVEPNADCYFPRHMILFRDSKNRIIGYKEVCLSCKGFRESKNLEGYNGFCYSQMNDLFKKAGIVYFDEDYE